MKEIKNIVNSETISSLPECYFNVLQL